MHCECCDKLLSDKEATARFAPEKPEDRPRYVMMCGECQSFLPKSVKILTRSDLSDELEREDKYDKWMNTHFDMGEYDD
jgi:hypothetical protein